MGREAKLKGVQVESIKKQIIKAEDMIGYCNGRLNAFDTQMVKDQKQFDEIKKVYNDHVKALQDQRTNQELFVKNLKVKISDLESKPIKQPNGKVICQYCGKEWSPQGIASHEKACKRKDEIAEVKAKLEKLQKEELIPVQIPEVKKIPKPEIKPDLSLQEVKDGREMLKQANSVLAEKEAELGQKEGE